MKLAAKTDIGRRDENQDNYRAARLDDGTAWGLICDGMGGPKGGRLAAQLASETMQERFLQGLSGCAAGEERSFLFSALRQANTEIRTAAQQGGENQFMGTTAVCCLVRDGVAHLAHVGDSRAYLVRRGEAQQLTRDHSVVQEMVDKGSLTPEEAYTHPNKNLITRALGVDKTVEPDYTNTTVLPGDVLLLCSDGLSNMVSAEELGRLTASTPFFDLPGVLVQKALDANGQDNITVLLVGIGSEEQA